MRQINCDQCLQSADYAIRYSGTDNFHPICGHCLQLHEQDVQEINYHEREHFNGNYGIVSFEIDDLEKYLQKNVREPLILNTLYIVEKVINDQVNLYTERIKEEGNKEQIKIWVAKITSVQNILTRIKSETIP